MVAYRHEKWIGQAIESVLSQDMDSWEIVVADDLSDDRTIEVATRYAQEDERGRIRILPHGEKFGPRQNYMRAMRACRGEFISQLDGDDFFVDRSKLSGQARFLDENPECSGVFGSWLETDGEGENGVLTEGFGLEGRTRFHPVDFGPNCVAASVSVMFRRGLFGEYPDWYTDVDVGDWPLHLLNTIHGGPYAYVPNVVSAHRNHVDGIWSKRTNADQAASTLRTHELFLRVLPEDLGSAMLKQMVESNARRGRGALRAGDHDAAEVFLTWAHARTREAGTRLKTRWKIHKARRQLRSQLRQAEAAAAGGG